MSLEAKGTIRFDPDAKMELAMLKELIAQLGEQQRVVSDV